MPRTAKHPPLGPQAPPTVRPGTVAPAQAALSGRRPTRRAWWGACLALFAVAWGGNQFTPLLGVYQDTGGLSQLIVNGLLFAYVLGIVPALGLAVPLARRLGPRAMMIGAVGGSLAGSALLIAGASWPLLLFVGRVVIGLALGVAMVTGSSWMGFLSAPPFEARVVQGRAARRSAMSLTAGFGLGPAIAGLLATSGLPALSTPYVPHLLVAVSALLMAWRTPSGTPHATLGQPSSAARGPHHVGLLLPIAGVAPWIFGSLGLAYAVLPQRIYPQLGSLKTPYLSLLCLTSLACGFLAQRLVARLRHPERVPAAPLGFALFLTGATVAGIAVDRLSPFTVFLLAAGLGVAYGLILIGCLQRIELTLPRDRHAGAVSLTYALAYIGFGLPMFLSWLNAQGVGYQVLLLGVAVIASIWAALFQLGHLLTEPGRRDSRPAHRDGQLSAPTRR